MSSRNTTAGAHDPLLLPSQPQSSRNSVRIDNEIVAARPRKLSKSGLSEEIPHQPKEPAAPPLTKKPSSFFRRRKKSVSETVPPVLIPAPASGLQPPSTTVKHNPSVSSLRELMNPYLSNPPDVRKGSTGKYDIAPQSQKTPVEKSTIKPVFPNSALHKSADKVEKRQIESSTLGDALSANADANSDDNLLHPHDQSFLLDNSSNETRLNASDTSVEKLMSNRAKEGIPSENDHEPAPFNDGSIQAAQPVVDFVQNTKGRKVLGKKESRPRKVSGDNHVVNKNKANEQSSPAAKASPVKEVVTATLSPDEATPRVWLRPEKSIEDLRGLAEISSLGGHNQPSHPDEDRPTSSRRSRIVKTVLKAPESTAIDPTSPEFDVTLPFREDKVLAQRVFEGDETLVSKAKAAAWLGEAGPDRARIRRAYMELFDWQNLNILAALRVFCGRLLLKGETQQVDRILDAFSAQWCACNANHGFKATGKHSIAQS